MERGTEYGLEQVYNVIDSRYRSGKPLIVTTNLSPDELQHPQDTPHARIYDWLLEMFPTLLTSDNNTARDAANLEVFLSAAVFCLTPVASDDFRSALKPSAFDPEKKDGNLSAQIISQEQPVSETAALNPDWVGMAHGLPERMDGHKPPEGKKPGRDVPEQECLCAEARNGCWNGRSSWATTAGGSITASVKAVPTAANRVSGCA